MAVLLFDLFLNLPNLNISNNITTINGNKPINVAIFGRIDCAESILSNIYEIHVANNIDDGQYNKINRPKVRKAGASRNDGKSNNNINPKSAAAMNTIKPNKTKQYVKKYIKNDKPFTRS